MARRHGEGGLSASRFAGSGPRGTLTKDDARELLSAHRASGDSLAQFARDRGIGAERLRWWQRQLGGNALASATDGPVRLLPVRVRRAKVSTGVAGSEHAGTSAFDVALPDGRSVRVPGDFDAASLRRLLAVLTEVT